jgi:AraC family transcriptional regulator
MPEPNVIQPSVNEEQWVRIAPSELTSRKVSEWQGLRADVVSVVEQKPFDYAFKSQQHLLIASEYSERDDGETSVEGLPKSALRNLTGRLTFVPAGHDFFGWQDPRVLTRVNYLYIDPSGPLLDSELRFSEIEFRPRLFFFDSELWRLTEKLKHETMNTGPGLTHYAEALGVLLGHELLRLNNSMPPVVARGGLSGRQQKRVADFIEEHLADNVRLAELAALANLSPYHFARAFKTSFGQPPHRYHLGRRIERAKALLAEHPVTEVALAVGFAETSSFSAAFRRVTGVSPRAFRRT